MATNVAKQKRVEMTVTKEGAAIKANKWVEGQIIECGAELAKYFKEKGFCKESKSEKKVN